MCSLFVLSLIHPSDAARKLRERSPFARLVASSAGGDHFRGTTVYRKGELSKGMIDRDWPHQVALPASRCRGHDYVTIRLYCEELSLCPRGHSFRRNDTDMTVFCFADRGHAEQFKERFGGDFIEPKDRPRWPGSA